MGSTLATSPSRGPAAGAEVGEGGQSLVVGEEEHEKGEGLRVVNEGDGGERGESLRMGEEGKEGEEGEEEEEEEDREVETRVLWFQLFCLRVCCCCCCWSCCRQGVEPPSLPGEQSPASNWAGGREGDNKGT